MFTSQGAVPPVGDKVFRIFNGGLPFVYTPLLWSHVRSEGMPGPIPRLLVLSWILANHFRIGSDQNAEMTPTKGLQSERQTTSVRYSERYCCDETAGWTRQEKALRATSEHKKARIHAVNNIVALTTALD